MQVFIASVALCRVQGRSDGEVQVLAKVILPVHGNQDWTVVDVADAADGEAAFADETADGSRIARFEGVIGTPRNVLNFLLI